MKKPLSVLMGIALLAAGLLLPANPSVAQEADAPPQRRPGFFSILGSILLTPPLLVVKTVTCVGTQVTAAVPSTSRRSALKAPTTAARMEEILARRRGAHAPGPGSCDRRRLRAITANDYERSLPELSSACEVPTFYSSPT